MLIVPVFKTIAPSTITSSVSVWDVRADYGEVPHVGADPLAVEASSPPAFDAAAALVVCPREVVDALERCLPAEGAVWSVAIVGVDGLWEGLGAVVSEIRAGYVIVDPGQAAVARNSEAEDGAACG